MAASAGREKVRFVSGGTECAAWHYLGTNGGCVIMAGGLAVPKEPATDRFARRFHEAGFAVPAFDYRSLGESGGAPRLVLPITAQIADWQAAIDFARRLPGVDPNRFALWAFSASGGHRFPVAARNPALAAVIAKTPLVDGPGSMRNTSRYQKPLAMLRVTARALLDVVGGLAGRPPRSVPLVGAPGSVAMPTMLDAQAGAPALGASNHPDWQQAVAARSALRVGFYRPGPHVACVHSPLLVLVRDEGQDTPPQASVRAASKAPRGELFRIPGGRYEPFLDGHERAVAAELSFPWRHRLGVPSERPRDLTGVRA